MTESQIKYYHLLKEIAINNETCKSIYEELGFDIENYIIVKNEHNQALRDAHSNSMKLGEIDACSKRTGEIRKILIEEYRMKKTFFTAWLTREQLPKHMILPNGTYYTIEYQGKVYENSPAQAVFIEKAHQQFLDGKKDFKSQYLVDEIGGYANISALFKNNDIYGSLIKSKRKGIHYLDIKI